MSDIITNDLYNWLCKSNAYPYHTATDTSDKKDWTSLGIVMPNDEYTIKVKSDIDWDKFLITARFQKIPTIEKVIFNPPATVVIWDDGTKTVVKTRKGKKKSDTDEFSEEYGLAMAISKKLFGSRSAFQKVVKNAERPGKESR